MEEIKYYPLTQSQLMMFYQMKYCIRKNCVNICTEIEFQDEIDTNLMLQSLYVGMLRATAACVRLHTNPDKTVVQYFSDAAPEKIEYIDYSGITEEEYEKILRKWNSTPFPNKLMDTQLYIVKLLKKPNGKHAIYGNYCHVIYDAYSIMATFKDITSVYQALRDGAPMPAPLPSPLPAYEADYKYRESEKAEIDRKYFDEVYGDTEPQFSTINGRNSKEFIEGKKYGKYHYTPFMKGAGMALTVPDEVNNAATEYALANKVSPQSVYLLAVRSYLAGMCDLTDIAVMNSVARRATLAQKRAGGTMVNSVPLRFRFGNELSFAQGAKEIYNVQCDSYRHANYCCGDILDMINAKYKAPQSTLYAHIGTTYQPYFMIDESINVKFRSMNNGTETQALYMSIMPCDSKGTMSINYSYQVAVVTPEKIRTFHQFIIDFIDAGTKNPEKPLSELMSEFIK